MGWKRAYLLGLLFEGCLLVAPLVLPKETWLYGEVHNLCLYSHYPLLAVGPLGLLLIPLAMPWVWVLGYLAISWPVVRLLDRLGISRRQRILLAGAVACLCLVAGVKAIVDGFDDTPRPFSPSPEVKSAVESNAAFALDLYRQLSGQPGNVFFSPYSISTALALTCAGARGRTEQEIVAALHLSQSQSNLHRAAGELTKRMGELQRGNRVTLKVANSIWCQQGDPFTSAFLDVAQGPYQATARLVDFADNRESATRDINRWVERNTGDQIKGLFDPGQLTADTSLVLCNAIYFKGRWASLFKRGATKPAPFFITKDQSVNVPMMFQKADFKMVYSNYDDYVVRLLELPYYGKDMSMVVILPEEVDGLAGLERRLDSNTLSGWLKELDQKRPTETAVWFPRFKTSQRLDLVPLFKSLGVTTAFDREAADLSGIDGKDYLYLSQALHQAFVEVDEEGTKAAAVTLFEARSRGGPSWFKADHPFIFLIRENSTGSILFLGRIVDPTK